MLSEYDRREDLDNHDHRFADFLKKENWRGDTVTTRDMVKFLTPDGEPIAIGVYDNTKCKYEVYVAKGLNDGR